MQAYRDDKMNYSNEELLDALRTEYQVDSDGTQFWLLDGKLHRVDGPAVIWTNGNQFWYFRGKKHREDGPAIIWADGFQDWYLNGKQYTEEEYKNELHRRATT
jgi:hypothetical protein